MSKNNETQKKDENNQKFAPLEKDLKEIIERYLKEENIPQNGLKFHLMTKKIKRGGDLSTNISYFISQQSKKEVNEVAEILTQRFENILSRYPEIEQVKSYKGYINFYLKKEKKEIPKPGTSKLSKEEKQKKKQEKKEKRKKFQEKKKEITKFLDIRIFQSSFVKEEFEIYKKYQHKIHKEPLENLTEDRYKLFYCETGLVYENNPLWSNATIKVNSFLFTFSFNMDLFIFNIVLIRKLLV